ncbi:MAG: hypothetical protein LBD38_04335 [Streptococcaceae bacterium]|jgi:hypothetical protein|nr:hypothetical protein [Streptococcaceae bacterium]
MNTKIIENMLIDTPIEGVFFKSTTDSTMDDAKHCHQVPSLHLTDQQTATRGRFRRPY